MKVILPAHEIPLGSHVTKLRGEKVYVLKDRLRVFGEGDSRREVVAEGGTRFLVHEGDANAIPGSTELVWVTTKDALRQFLHEQDMEREDK